MCLTPRRRGIGFKPKAIACAYFRKDTHSVPMRSAHEESQHVLPVGPNRNGMSYAIHLFGHCQLAMWVALGLSH